MLVRFCLEDRRPRRWLGGLEGQARPSHLVVENMNTPNTGQGLFGYSSAHASDFKASPGWRGTPRKRALSRTARSDSGSLLSSLSGVKRLVLNSQGHHQGYVGGGAQSRPGRLHVPHPCSIQQVWSVGTGRRREELSSPAIPPLSDGSQPYKPRPTRTRVFGLHPTWPASA